MRVDVAIPCYNYAKYLPYCVSTVLSQRDVDVRILIVDDKSPDNTPEVAKQLMAQDERISYTRNENNLGLVGSLNRGVVQWASAPYTLALSADDALTPGALARAVSVMEANPNVGMTYGMALVFGERNDEYVAPDKTQFDSKIIRGADFIHAFCDHKNGVASPTALVRTSVQQRIGGYEPKFPRTCDVEMWMRFATQGDIGIINAPQAYYRWHSANMSAGQISLPLDDLRELIETCEHDYEKWGQNIEGFKGWIDEMRARFAREACWLAGVALERGDEAKARAGIDFAKSLDAGVWQTKPFWTYQVKRFAGPAVKLLRGGQSSEANLYAPFAHGQEFGRW